MQGLRQVLAAVYFRTAPQLKADALLVWASYTAICSCSGRMFGHKRSEALIRAPTWKILEKFRLSEKKKTVLATLIF